MRKEEKILSQLKLDEIVCASEWVMHRKAIPGAGSCKGEDSYTRGNILGSREKGGFVLNYMRTDYARSP